MPPWITSAATPPDSAGCGAHLRSQWGTITASGARFRYNPKTAPLPSGILPHIAAECCPTSNGISAPLRPEYSAYGLDAGTDDEADACVLAHIGACLIGREEPRNKAQREVLTTLTAEKKPKNSD